MDIFTAMRIAISGSSAQRTRLATLSSNLANANSTRRPDGQPGPYMRKDPIFQEIKATEFDKHLDRADRKVSGVQVTQIVEDQTPGARVYDPGHPDADASGYVQLPNVNVVTELTDLMATSRAYEANVMAVKAAKEMVNAALGIVAKG